MVSLIPRDQIAGIGHSVVLNFAFTYGMIALFALLSPINCLSLLQTVLLA